MGHKCYHEVTDNAPMSWTIEQRFVAAVIALDANDKTRKSQISLDRLLRKTGLSPAGLRRALAGLAASGYDFRVAVAMDKRGKRVYAYRGHAMDYMVPNLEKGAHPPRTFTEPETPLKVPMHGHPTTKELTRAPLCGQCGFEWFGTLVTRNKLQVCGYCAGIDRVSA